MALLFATAPATDGGPAAALALADTTIAGRLLAQLESLGVGRAWVVTRPEWAAAVETAAAGTGTGASVTVVASSDLSEDLRLAAEIAGGVEGALVLASANAVTHREALAGLLADPRVATGVLSTRTPLASARPFGFRAVRKRVVSVGSAYHRVTRATGYVLDVVKVDRRDRDCLVAAALRLADLAAEHPAAWAAEVEHAADGGPARTPTDDALPLLLVGLVRAEVELFPSSLRGFFWATPLSAADAERAGQELGRYDEDTLLLDSAVKSNDGFFATFFVSPYSKYLARFAARRGWSPNAVTIASLGIGIAAAGAFAVGSRASLVAGAILLQVSFTVDCVDGQLARYTRTFSKLGAWLDSVFDRAKEHLVYAGLAIGSTHGFGDDVWLLAAAALALQTVRHTTDFAYVASERSAVAPAPQPPLEEPEDLPPASVAEARERPAAPADVPAGTMHARGLLPRGVLAVRTLHLSGWARWGNRIVRLPIGERFALVSLTAALFTPRVTFVALLAWGAVGAAYAVSVRILAATPATGRLVRAVLR